MKVCQECHRKDMMVDNLVARKFDSQQAVSYENAMHGMCIACHAMVAADPTVRRPDLLPRCGTCHNEGTRSERLYAEMMRSQAGKASGP